VWHFRSLRCFPGIRFPRNALFSRHPRTRTVVGLYAWLFSRLDIPGAKEVMELIVGTEKEEQEHEGLPFLALPAYMPKQHARAMAFVSAVRWETTGAEKAG